MRKILIGPAMLSAAAAANAQDSGEAPAPEADQVTATADAMKKTARDMPRPWNEPDGDRNVFKGDYAIVGLGLASAPTYEGSNNSRLFPAAGAIGRVGGIGFRFKGPSLTTDFIPDESGARIGLSLGPNVRFNGGRRGNLKDPIVARLPKLKGTIEAGVSGGLTFKQMLTKQDSLALGIGIRWDVSGKHGGRVISASASYLLPVHKAQVFGIQASAEFVDRKYAQYRYSISAAGSAASGLPAYSARGGLKETSVGAFTARDLSGDFLDGGVAAGVGVMYTRLQGSAARTPLTRIRGSRNQWILGGGLAYAF